VKGKTPGKNKATLQKQRGGSECQKLGKISKPRKGERHLHEENLGDSEGEKAADHQKKKTHREANLMCVIALRGEK